MPVNNNSLNRILVGIFTLLVCSNVNAQLSKQASVARAIFTTGIENREPVNQVLVLSNSSNTIYFFTDLRHLQGQKIIHRWEYEGKTVTSKIFKVDGPRWRVYSKIMLPTEKTGTWSVVVTTDQGLPIKAAIFKYVSGGDKQNVIIPLE